MERSKVIENAEKSSKDAKKLELPSRIQIYLYRRSHTVIGTVGFIQGRYSKIGSSEKLEKLFEDFVAQCNETINEQKVEV